jgi:hypothetical protein
MIPGGVKVLVASNPVDFRKVPTGLWRWYVMLALIRSMVRCMSAVRKELIE